MAPVVINEVVVPDEARTTDVLIPIPPGIYLVEKAVEVEPGGPCAVRNAPTVGSVPSFGNLWVFFKRWHTVGARMGGTVKAPEEVTPTIAWVLTAVVKEVPGVSFSNFRFIPDEGFDKPVFPVTKAPFTGEGTRVEGATDARIRTTVEGARFVTFSLG